MIVLHGGLCEEKFIVWGEAPATATQLPAGSPPALPFSAAVEQVEALLRQCGVAQADERTPAILLAPTEAGMPLPSTPMIDESAAGKHAAELQPWRITGIALPAADCMRLLFVANQRRLLQRGVVRGDDLKFWSAVMSFAAGLVAREQFLPGLRMQSDNWHAVWDPVIAGDDVEKFTEIVAAAPDVCRALLPATGPSLANEAGRLQVVHRFISIMVDYMVRSAVRDGNAAAPATTAGASTIHDRWLNALRGRESKLSATSEEIRSLQADLARWRRGINATVNAPFRLCFRLEEPRSDEIQRTIGDNIAIDESPWRLSYLLQSTADPSLVVPAETVWGGKQLPLYLRRTKSGARQYLLAALGAASAIYAPVEESLLSAQPSAVELSTQQAYEFLSQQAVMLQQAGFAVMLPGWWARSRRKLRAGMVEKNSTLQVKSDKLSMDTLVDFEWQVALGDQTMSRRELEELARLKVPLVRVRGEWVELTPEQLEAALKLASKPKQKMALRNVIQVAFGAEPAGGLPFAGIESGGVVSSLLNQLSAGDNFQPLPAPQQFHGELRPYQQRGYAWLDFLSRWGMGACLADDMGLGKTVQTLALLQRNWHSWPAAERLPVLLVCPTSVIGNWKNEVQKFTPDLPVLIHHGSARQKRQAFITEAQNYALVITSYALLVKDTDALTQVGWAGVILDEAQNIKNSETKMAKAARQLPAQFKIALTGTPVENHLGDLWSIMEFLNPGLLGTASAFRKNFIVPVQIDRDADALERLHRITRPFILRRVKTDKEIIRDLPEKLETKDFCSLTREQTTLYKAVLREMEDRLASADKEIERKGVVLATIGKLKQICNHPALFLHDKSSLAGRSGKLARLTSMLDECLQEGDCTLIFTQFAEMGELLKQYLQDSFGEEVLFLHGDVPQKRRQEMIERFQQADGPRLFVLSLKAGGVGLNLTRANQVFHFDRWWNPAVENQATDRAYRIGQQRTVHVHKFICSGTMEEKIDSLIESKQEIAQLTVGVGESWLTNLSDKQLREVLALSREALQE